MELFVVPITTITSLTLPILEPCFALLENMSTPSFGNALPITVTKNGRVDTRQNIEFPQLHGTHRLLKGYMKLEATLVSTNFDHLRRSIAACRAAV